MDYIWIVISTWVTSTRLRETLSQWRSVTGVSSYSRRLWKLTPWCGLWKLTPWCMWTVKTDPMMYVDCENWPHDVDCENWPHVDCENWPRDVDRICMLLTGLLPSWPLMITREQWRPLRRQTCLTKHPHARTKAAPQWLRTRIKAFVTHTPLLLLLLLLLRLRLLLLHTHTQSYIAGGGGVTVVGESW